MSSKVQIAIFTIMLSVIGISIAWYKSSVLGVPLVPHDTISIYRIGAKITFEPTKDPVLVSFSIPSEQNGIKIISSDAGSQGYGYNIKNDKHGKRAEWAKREVSGEQTLFYNTDVVIDKEYQLATIQVIPQELPKEELNEWDSATKKSADSFLKDIYDHSADAHSFAAELIKKVHKARDSQLLNLILDKYGYTLEEFTYKLLRYQGIHTRVVKGIFLEDGRRNLRLKSLIETYNGKTWQMFSIEDGKIEKPENFFVWQRGGVSLLDSEGTQNAKVRFSIAERKVPTSSLALDESLKDGAALIDFSLFSLPISEQNAFKHILLVPIGALVVAFLRIILGLKTSGTFMPILLALAFMETKLVTGLILFIAIVGAGLVIRSYLSHLNLLLVARISAVVIVVIGIMSVFSIVSYKLGINEALTITFFPMIILAWTIERMSILWEEEGAREVYVQGGGSLFVASLAYFAMSNETLSYLSFNFPELLLVVLSLIIVLGRYSGYRLLELIRFKSQVKDI
jgi:hypothetical protein